MEANFNGDGRAIISQPSRGSSTGKVDANPTRTHLCLLAHHLDSLTAK